MLQDQQWFCIDYSSSYGRGYLVFTQAYKFRLDDL